MVEENKILIVTGGLLSVKEKSIWSAIKKQYKQFSSSKSQWLETKIKLVAAEPLLLSMLQRKSKHVKEFFTVKDELDTPELTEVVLADLLFQSKIPFEIMSYDLLFTNKKKALSLIDSCKVVFASTTLLHDLSEMVPLIKLLKRDHNKIVIGGALTGSLCHYWEGSADIDIMAIGYGELLIQPILDWMKSGFKILEPTEGGRLIKKEHTLFLYSANPISKNLDFLPTPNWRVAETYHQKKFKLINYESVRGCPYRCSFCNYPYLFNDTKFRYKSAEKMASDWEWYYKQMGVEYIVCLDSLFTMPRKRLISFCELLIEKNIKIKWVCYARADDLVDESTVELMAKAGAIQLQIGLESGNEVLLQNMNKRCSIASNLKAIENCRKYGITSMVTLIVGYPGETESTLKDTYELMKLAQPDFYFLATFSTRVEGVPILSDTSKTKFKLQTMSNPYSFAPYWIHETMSCTTVGNHVRELSRKLMKEKISLEGSIFYKGIYNYKPQMRQTLLEYQSQLFEGNGLLSAIFNRLNKFIDSKLVRDFNACLLAGQLK